MQNIYIITPWFKSRSGGAEIYAENLALSLSERKLPVTVLTTTCKSPFDPWDENYYQSGEDKNSRVKTLRFPVDQRSVQTYIEFYKIISGGNLISFEQEEDYLSNTIRSRQMESYIAENKNNGIFLTIPYTYGVSYFGGLAALPNTIPIPCLHDEPAAWFKSMKALFEKSKAMLFLTEPERRLATTIYSLKGKPSAILGGGISGIVDGDKNRFAQKTKITEPFILFVGRKVPGKGIDTLLQYWIKMKKEIPSKYKLVIIGGGEMPRIANIKDYDITDLGQADEQMKFDAIAASSALCHLSVKESLSIVLLEAWMMKKPVIVSEMCPVTTYQALNSGGGIPVLDYYDFKHAAHAIFTDLKFAVKMGESGFKYVKSSYTWEKTAENLEKFLKTIFS